MSSENDNNKIIAVNTFYLYIRLLFTMVVGLIVSRIVLKTLGVEDYGIYNLVGGFVTLLSIFTFSISGTCQRFLVYQLGKGDKKRLSETFCTISILLLFFSLFFFLVAGLVGSWFVANVLNIPQDKTGIAVVVFLCSLAVFCFQLLAIPYNSLVVAHEKMNFYAFMSIMESICKLIIVYSLYYVTSNKLIFYALFLAIISGCSMICYRFYCRILFEESSFSWVFNKSIFKEILSFTLWVGLGSSAGLLKDQGGSILLNLFFGVTLNAACGIANQVRAVVTQLSSNIGLAISPQITKSYSSGDTERSIKLTFLLAKVQTLMVLVVALPIIIETPRLLALWLGSIPDYTISFVRFILIFGVIQTLEQSSGPLILAVGKIKKFQLLASLITISVLPMTYLCFYLKFHPASYYIVCIMIESSLFFYCYRFLSNEIALPYKSFITKVFLRLMLTAVNTLVIFFGIKAATDLITIEYLQMTINIVACILFFIGCSFLVAFDSNERLIVLTLIRNRVQHHN